MKLLDSYTRLIAPFGLTVLLVGVVLGLVSGGVVLVWAEGATGNEIGDLATSYALIVMFSSVFGLLIAIFVIDVFGRVFQHTLGALLKRVDKLIRRLEAMRVFYGVSPVEYKSYDNTKSINVFTAVCMSGYALGFTLASTLLIYSMLQGYTYADAPRSAEFASLLLMMASYSYFASLIALGTALIFVLLICSRIAMRWNMVRSLEKRVDLLESRMATQEFTNENTAMLDVVSRAMDMSDAVVRVNMKFMKMLGIRLDAGIQHQILR